MKFVFNDGGREAAGFKGTTGDCVCRSIAIAADRPYKEVYDTINEFAKKERTGTRKRGKSSARTGVYKDTIKKVMEHYGFKWVPCMKIGQGCTVHLTADELPKGRIVVSLSRHNAAVIDGVIHDTYDCSRDGTRCVYGYFVKEQQRDHAAISEFISHSLQPFVKQINSGIEYLSYTSTHSPIKSEYCSIIYNNGTREKVDITDAGKKEIARKVVNAI